MIVVKNVFAKKVSGLRPRSARAARVTRNPEFEVRIGKCMNITTKIENPTTFAVAIDNQIRLIKWLAMPQRDRDKLKFGAMRNVGESANPCCIGLAHGQESGDFLISAPSN